MSYRHKPGPRNDITDVATLRVGHHTRVGDGYQTGTTVLVGDRGGFVAGVDVRGGAPGTRETDLLHPTASAEKVHAITLTGGSAFGLAAASGVAAELESRGIGLNVGTESEVVPIVPAAVVFDLGRGGNFAARPDPEFGVLAVREALDHGGEVPVALGCVGAGAGTLCCGIKGGVGSASVILPEGITVGALVIANAVGSPVDPRTGELWGARHLLEADATKLQPPSPEDTEAVLTVVRERDPYLTAAPSRRASSNTSLVIVATDAALTKAQCTKLAGSSHDGLARAFNPVHTAYDGDAVFAVSTGTLDPADELGWHRILSVSGDVVTRAVVRAMLAATSVTTPAGTWRSYRDLAPSAVR